VDELLVLPFLKKLNLSYNEIQELYDLPMTLEELNISHNQITDLNISISKLKNLVVLQIAHNKCQDIQALVSCSKLKHLFASYNMVPIFI
jgi:Leucine-rich repeat (LRR) protein